MYGQSEGVTYSYKTYSTYMSEELKAKKLCCLNCIEILPKKVSKGCVIEKAMIKRRERRR